MNKSSQTAVVSGAIGVAIGIAVTAAFAVHGVRLRADIWGTVAQWASAVGTTCAVVVAIWGDSLRRRILRPRLELALTNPEGVEVFTKIIGADGKPNLPVQARWLHATVSNPNRWFPIKDVTVYLLRVEQRQAGQWTEAWIGPSALSWRHGELPTKSFGPDWDADILSAVNGVLRFRTTKADPLLTFEGEHELRAVLQARGLDLDSEKLTVNVFWSGSDLRANVSTV